MSAGKGAGVGKIFYNVAGTFARMVDMSIVAYPGGLTAINTVRRTENGMSIAARFGGEASNIPGVGQRVYGFNQRAKTPGQQRKNLVRLALAQMRNVFEILPAAKELRYNLRTGTLMRNGENAESFAAELLRNDKARIYSLGRTSLVHAALTNELLERIARPNGRARIETTVAWRFCHASRVSPGPTAGRGLKQT